MNSLSGEAADVKISLNPDTGFLKVVAIVSMVTDHMGKGFFPTVMILQVIGRIAFPIFAYCLAAGCLRTRDIKKYMLRLFVFAVIAQPVYTLNFYRSFEYIYYLNILFTLFFGVLGICGLLDLRRRWWMLILCFAACLFLDLEYGAYGIALIVAFYVFIEQRRISALIVAAILAIPFFWAPYIMIGGMSFGVQGFAILAMPFIYIRTDFNPQIKKYFFYAFYPAHILVILTVKNILK